MPDNPGPSTSRPALVEMSCVFAATRPSRDAAAQRAMKTQEYRCKEPLRVRWRARIARISCVFGGLIVARSTTLCGMHPHRLDVATARRIAVTAQLLADPPPTDLVEVVSDLTLLHVDPTNAVAPSADLVLWSRLGPGYDPGTLVRALEVDRTLFEHNGVIRPMDDLPLFLERMAAAPRYEGTRAWLDANAEFARDVLARLEADGPLASRDIPDTAAVSWKSSGWTNDRNVTQLLEILAEQGKIGIAHREGRERFWDVANRLFPAGLTPIPREQADRELDVRRLASLGIARAKGTAMPVEPNTVGDAGEPAIIEGVPGEWRVDPAALDTAFTSATAFAGRTALLSPLDRLIYDRKRMLELWDFDYTLEMYKPAAARHWGFFALPVLHDERLIGKVDSKADRKGGTLTINALHEDLPWDPATNNAVVEQIEWLAEWLGLEVVGI